MSKSLAAAIIVQSILTSLTDSDTFYPPGLSFFFTPCLIMLHAHEPSATPPLSFHIIQQRQNVCLQCSATRQRTRKGKKHIKSYMFMSVCIAIFTPQARHTQRTFMLLTTTLLQKCHGFSSLFSEKRCFRLSEMLQKCQSNHHVHRLQTYNTILAQLSNLRN
jgi:hypothetical protein